MDIHSPISTSILGSPGLGSSHIFTFGSPGQNVPWICGIFESWKVTHIQGTFRVEGLDIDIHTLQALICVVNMYELWLVYITYIYICNFEYTRILFICWNIFATKQVQITVYIMNGRTSHPTLSCQSLLLSYCTWYHPMQKDMRHPPKQRIHLHDHSKTLPKSKT